MGVAPAKLMRARACDGPRDVRRHARAAPAGRLSARVGAIGGEREQRRPGAREKEAPLRRCASTARHSSSRPGRHWRAARSKALTQSPSLERQPLASAGRRRARVASPVGEIGWLERGVQSARLVGDVVARHQQAPATGRSSGGRTCELSPRPRMSAAPPRTKKGTSEPSSAARSRSSASREPRAPQRVEADQRGRGVARAAAQARPRRECA